jgi:hypothetical protein
MRGEKIYEYDLDITGVTDHGVSLQSIMSGEQKMPPQGTRFERYVRGARKGPPVGATAGRRLCPNARGWPDRSRPSGDDRDRRRPQDSPLSGWRQCAARGRANLGPS